MEQRHVYLVGFMGSGKSTVGEILANKLGAFFVDLDRFIEETVGVEISEIFSEYGEEHFREVESYVLNEVAASPDPSVVATGGGIVLKEDNWRVMEESGVTIHLHASIDTLWNRVSGTNNRPLAEDRQQFESLYWSRLPLYRRAQIEVVSHPKSPEEVAEEVLDALGLIEEEEKETHPQRET